MVKDDAGRHGFTMTIETPKPNPDLAFIHSWFDLINSRDALFKRNPVCKGGYSLLLDHESIVPF